MGSRIRIRGAIALVLALLLLPASLAQADDAYQRVAAAYGRSAGRLDPCSFSKAELQAAAPTTPSTATPAPGSATQPTAAAVAPKAPATHSRDTTPLLVAAIAIGVLALLALLTWAWWRLRGLDPSWTKSWRHAWGEAAYRTTSTWSEFTDWLRLGR
jgi:cytochrome c-type biogenesis protein CcmH/NrfG